MEEKWSNHTVVRECTPDVYFEAITLILMKWMGVFISPYPAIVSVNVARHVECRFVTENNIMQKVLILVDTL
jgi:hypothetical protein